MTKQTIKLGGNKPANVGFKEKHELIYDSYISFGGNDIQLYYHPKKSKGKNKHEEMCVTTVQAISVIESIKEPIDGMPKVYGSFILTLVGNDEIANLLRDPIYDDSTFRIVGAGENDYGLIMELTINKVKCTHVRFSSAVDDIVTELVFDYEAESLSPIKWITTKTEDERYKQYVEKVHDFNKVKLEEEMLKYVDMEKIHNAYVDLLGNWKMRIFKHRKWKKQLRILSKVLNGISYGLTTEQKNVIDKLSELKKKKDEVLKNED